MGETLNKTGNGSPQRTINRQSVPPLFRRAWQPLRPVGSDMQHGQGKGGREPKQRGQNTAYTPTRRHHQRGRFEGNGIALQKGPDTTPHSGLSREAMTRCSSNHKGNHKSQIASLAHHALNSVYPAEHYHAAIQDNLPVQRLAHSHVPATHRHGPPILARNRQPPYARQPQAC